MDKILHQIIFKSKLKAVLAVHGQNGNCFDANIAGRSLLFRNTGAGHQCSISKRWINSSGPGSDPNKVTISFSCKKITVYAIGTFQKFQNTTCTGLCRKFELESSKNELRTEQAPHLGESIFGFFLFSISYN
jgi:hypothetical protein